MTCEIEEYKHVTAKESVQLKWKLEKNNKTGRFHTTCSLFKRLNSWNSHNLLNI